jgi:hypothetical protein
MKITADGFFLELWSKNAHGETVYPYIKGKKGMSERGFDVTPTGNKSEYRLMTLDEFLNLLANDAFAEGGHIRMQPRQADAKGKSGGFLIPKANMTESLIEELRARKVS